jgi:hypothetical protein
MWKSFFLKVLRFVALTLLIVQVTFSSALAQETLSPEAATNQSPEAITPSKIERAAPDNLNADQITAAPKRDRKKASGVSVSRLTFPQPPNPYDAEAIDKFDEQLYGAGS